MPKKPLKQHAVEPQGSSRGMARRIKLRNFLFGFLVLFGALPLVLSSITTIIQNRDGLETQELLNMSKQSEVVTIELSDFVISIRHQLEQLGSGLQTMPASVSAQARQDWTDNYIQSFQELTRERFGTRVTDLGDGRQFGRALGPVMDAMDRALGVASNSLESSYSLINRGRDETPALLVTEPVVGSDRNGDPLLLYVLQAVAPLDVPKVDGKVFLIDVAAGGEVLWSDDTDAEVVRAAVSRTALVQQFVSVPYGILSDEYKMRVGGTTRTMIGQIGPLADTGWAVLVHKPKASAFGTVRRLVRTSLVAALVMVLLALGFAGVAARLIGQPIQHLAQTSKEIAAGNFGRRVVSSGIGSEIADLADSFNSMSHHVEVHVERLREAVQLNRDLFIGSVRAFLAAIEAKEPYTRGHSERVASFSQAISRRLKMTREFEEKIWIAGLLHDVGKIGIEDRVLNKGDVLTDEEYEEMKRHPTIGAEIMSSIDQLKEMIPAIRWHHEKWNGKGYPDGISGERIPLMARVVAVADTFDAVTTQRVYQDPFTPQEALEIIKKLDGTGFDPRVVAAFLEAFHAGDIAVVPTVSSAQQRPAQPVSATEAAVHS